MNVTCEFSTFGPLPEARGQLHDGCYKTHDDKEAHPGEQLERLEDTLPFINILVGVDVKRSVALHVDHRGEVC